MSKVWMPWNAYLLEFKRWTGFQRVTVGDVCGEDDKPPHVANGRGVAVKQQPTASEDCWPAFRPSPGRTKEAGAMATGEAGTACTASSEGAGGTQREPGPLPRHA